MIGWVIFRDVSRPGRRLLLFVNISRRLLFFFSSHPPTVALLRSWSFIFFHILFKTVSISPIESGWGWKNDYSIYFYWNEKNLGGSAFFLFLSFTSKNRPLSRRVRLKAIAPKNIYYSIKREKKQSAREGGRPFLLVLVISLKNGRCILAWFDVFSQVPFLSISRPPYPGAWWDFASHDVLWMVEIQMKKDYNWRKWVGRSVWLEGLNGWGPSDTEGKRGWTSEICSAQTSTYYMPKRRD